MFIFSISIIGPIYAGFFDYHPIGIIQTNVDWTKAVCDAGKNQINSSLINRGDVIPVDGAGTYFVKRKGEILCEWNLEPDELDGTDNNMIWDEGESISFNLMTNKTSHPCLNNTFSIESNHDYILELKVADRPRAEIETTCTGKHY